jgi:diguanylate cyclase (GGDEF)-like protein/PAS domain S-box-containing protein
MPRLVILDDRASNRSIFAALARQIAADVQVETFSGGASALAWIAGNTPDLVITDFKMPGMDGAEFIRRFRVLPGCEDVPVVVITVYEERALRLQALEVGATDFLLSPVDHHEFVTRARNLLKLRHQQLVIKNRTYLLERELQDSERSRQQILRDSREKLAQVIDTVPAKISAFDHEGRCVFVNAYHAALYDLDPGHAVGKPAEEILGAERADRSIALDRHVFLTGQPLPTFEEELTGKDGSARFFITTKSPLRDGEGQIVAVLTTSIDITERKHAERHLVHIAHHDDLTGLANRQLLHDRMRREIARARRGDRYFALHILDLDRFKAVNDAWGHHFGDQLLRAAANRLRAAVRETDTVARLGGDEFAILQTDVTRPEDTGGLAQRLTRLFAEPFVIEGQEITTSTSIGIAIHPTDGADIEDLFKVADLAMYKAKAGGRNTFRLFSPQMRTAARDELVLETELRQAIGRGEFLLHYQPQVDLRTGGIIGAEALVRWAHPKRGLVRPLDFLPLAEETGLIIPINEWVLREACHEAVVWKANGLPPLRIAVNLSPIQFRNQDVVALVKDVLAESGLDPTLLELELTESILIQNTETVVGALRELGELGVSLAIDDFGTGYSSLAYVKNLPVDRLKIDQCFIRNLPSDPSDTAIVRTVINLGHSLGLKVIAEGVDTIEKIGFLRAEGCEEAQGFFYSLPVPSKEFQTLVNRKSRVARSA